MGGIERWWDAQMHGGSSELEFGTWNLEVMKQVRGSKRNEAAT